MSECGTPLLLALVPEGNGCAATTNSAHKPVSFRLEDLDDRVSSISELMMALRLPLVGEV